MKLNHLHVFLSVVKYRNFSEAGREQHLSQPTVTQMIKQLEEELSTKLFHRTTHHVELTESGKLFVPYAEELIQLIEEAKRKISLTEENVSGPLWIGTSLTTSEVVIPRVLGIFQRMHPQVRLKVEVMNSELIMQALESHQHHFGIIEAPLKSHHLKIEPFMADELVCVTSTRHSFPFLPVQQTAVTYEQVSRLPLIMREKGSGTRLVLEKAFIEHGIDEHKLQIVVELNSTEAIKEATEAGLGVAILSKHSVRKESELGLLRVLPFMPLPLTRQFFYAYLPEKPPRRPVEAMLQLFQEMFLSNTDFQELP